MKQREARNSINIISTSTLFTLHPHNPFKAKIEIERSMAVPRKTTSLRKLRYSYGEASSATTSNHIGPRSAV